MMSSRSQHCLSGAQVDGSGGMAHVDLGGSCAQCRSRAHAAHGAACGLASSRTASAVCVCVFFRVTLLGAFYKETKGKPVGDFDSKPPFLREADFKKIFTNMEYLGYHLQTSKPIQASKPSPEWLGEL